MTTQDMNQLEAEIMNVITLSKVKALGLNTKKILFGNPISNKMLEKNKNLFFFPEENEEVLLSINAGNEIFNHAYSSIIITTQKIWFRLIHLDNFNMINEYIHGAVPLNDISSINSPL